MFAHSSPKFVEHLYDNYFDFLSSKLVISIFMFFFLRLLLSFGICFSVSSLCLTLCVCFYVLGKTTTSPSLEGMVFVENEPYLSILP